MALQPTRLVLSLGLSAASHGATLMMFEANDVPIAYLDEAAPAPARTPPVLLLHGFASSAAVNWVDTGWVRLLVQSGRRVIAPDHRGHGRSGKPHDPAAYATDRMAADALALLDHCGIAEADVIGYSMGARIAAFLTLRAPGRVRRVVFGGLGIHLVEGVGLPPSIGEAMEAPSLDDLLDPTQRMFRRFAESTGNDLAALAACIRGSRQTRDAAAVSAIACPALVAVGTRDQIAGDARRLAALLPHGRVLDIPDRDHNPAVGDRQFKSGVLAFLDDPP